MTDSAAPVDSPSAFLAVARGDRPADLVLRNARLVNVFSGQVETTDVVIAAGKIAALGPGYSANQEIDLQNAYVAPGLIDAHVHIESSLCIPPQFATAVVPRGVTTVVADPHEIANVAGVAGIRFMAAASRDLPLRVELMAPSCVPATDMASSGAKLTADDLAALLCDGTVRGLAEVMNFPGVINGAADVAAKIRAFRDRPIDGHAPAVRDKQLNAYVAAGIGSDHECFTPEEAQEKLSRGLYILIREATNARNLEALLPIVTPQNARRICFCTDDRQPADLLNSGSVDEMLRRAIAFGVDPIDAFRMCTLNAAEWFNLHDRGAIAPGRVADLIVFDDLKNPTARGVYFDGKLAAEEGRLLDPVPQPVIPDPLRSTCKIKWSGVRLDVGLRKRHIRVIGHLANQLVTENRVMNATIRAGNIMADPQRDILKIAVIERHNETGRCGIGFIQGFGLQQGAIAGTVAHDHHNLITIGVDNNSILTAIKAVLGAGGGLAAANGQQVLATLPLPVGGLMSDRPIEEVKQSYDKLLTAAKQLGSKLEDPFMAMSFMGLEVIPSLKLTDLGLVDVDKFAMTELFANG
ncbi:MAG TPA: adenine deaminase [Tepidisphaeraceae bacterium]|jgi:adenine deaminase